MHKCINFKMTPNMNQTNLSFGSTGESNQKTKTRLRNGKGELSNVKGNLCSR